MYECIENERDKKENRLDVQLIDELNGYLDWIFLNFFFSCTTGPFGNLVKLMALLRSMSLRV